MKWISLIQQLRGIINLNEDYNISYNEIYVSIMNIGENIEFEFNNLIYIFHEEKLEGNEIKCIEDIINNF